MDKRKMVEYVDKLSARYKEDSKLFRGDGGVLCVVKLASCFYRGHTVTVEEHTSEFRKKSLPRRWGVGDGNSAVCRDTIGKGVLILEELYVADNVKYKAKMRPNKCPCLKVYFCKSSAVLVGLGSG